MTATLPQPMIETVRQRRKAGEGLGRIGAELGIPWQTLHKALKPQPREPRPAKRRPESLTAIAAKAHPAQTGVFGQPEYFPISTGWPAALFDPSTLTPKGPAVARNGPAKPLVERYRPHHLSDLVGQTHAVSFLRGWCANPHPQTFLFEGATGTGKTSAARAMAAELGCLVDQGEFGGLHSIASGEQTAETVRSTMDVLHQIPFFGSGWKVLIVNEADRMSPAAEMVWLDRLETLPRSTVVIFTTNDAGKLSQRFKDRCLQVTFVSDEASCRLAAFALARTLWTHEAGAEPSEQTLASILDKASVDGAISFRRVVQAVEAALCKRS